MLSINGVELLRRKYKLWQQVRSLLSRDALGVLSLGFSIGESFRKLEECKAVCGSHTD